MHRLDAKQLTEHTVKSCNRANNPMKRRNGVH